MHAATPSSTRPGDHTRAGLEESAARHKDPARGRDLSVVIVTYNSAPDLADCLTSLLGATKGLDVLIVVADSGSTDDTPSIARRFPVRSLPGGDEGFARACNRALTLEEVRSSRYVLFLNPDTAFLAGSLTRLIAECRTRPERHLFTIRQVDRAGRLVHTLRRFPSAGTYWADALPIGPLRQRGERLVESSRYERESECDWAMGSFLLLSHVALSALGGFDERFFLYSEEVDLCRRAKALGWSVTYLPSVTIVHKGQSRVRDRRRARHQARAKLIYAEKWSSRGARLLMRAALAARYGRAALAPRSPAVRASARAALLGVLSYRSFAMTRPAVAHNVQAIQRERRDRRQWLSGRPVAQALTSWRRKTM